MHGRSQNDRQGSALVGDSDIDDHQSEGGSVGA